MDKYIGLTLLFFLFATVNYRPRIISSLSDIGPVAWDTLVAAQADRNPFLSYGFLDALHEAGCADTDTGWQPQYLTLWNDDGLEAALPLYVKYHSYGEYVFDWAWADAYRRNRLPYYPKLLSAIPFTPVEGNRLLARHADAEKALITQLSILQSESDVSSTHILFPPERQARQLESEGFLLRSGVQFHWTNQGYRDFNDFLETLDRKKRKNIRAERRKVHDEGIRFRHISGTEATEANWRFFKRCYDHTYAAHYSTPYLNLEFFLRIASSIPQHLLLVIAERGNKPIASSLVFHDDQTLYGRYWGAIEDVPCLHFETAYYQPLEFCIANRLQHFEGGAQGEHKLARGFLPHKTWSAHWLARPDFSDAIERFLAQEAGGIDSYIEELGEHSPFKQR